MSKMETDGGRGQENQQEIIETDSEPLRGRSTRRIACFNPLDCTIATPTVDDEAYVEVTLDLGDDSVAVKSVSPVGCWGTEDPALTQIARTLVRGSSSLGSSLIRTASNSIKKVSQELQSVASLSRRPAGYRRIHRNKSASAHAFNGLKFISNAHGAKGWPAVKKRFDDFAVDGFLPRSRFGQCIGTKESTEFDIELFDALARRRNIPRYSINKEELKDFWDQISDQSFDSRLQIFFDMVDKNADGRINEEEVRKIISLSASDNKLTNIQERAEEYARLIMEELDPNNNGYIEIHSLEMLLLQAPTESVPPQDSHSQQRSKLLSQMLKPTPEPNPLRRWYRKAWYFLEDQWKRVWVVVLWLCICAGLFTWKFMQYRHRAVYHVMGYCVCVAKGGAETLKLNMALILLPVCRNTITWLRYKTKLGAIVPLDDNFNFHMVIASGIVVGVGLHAISHLTCDFPRLLHASEQAYIPMKPFFGNARPNDYWWFVKGTDGWTGIVMVVLMAIAFTLALPCFRRHEPKTTNARPKLFDSIIGFNSFWYSHHLFVVVYVLLIIHSIFIYLSNEWYEKTTWMYLAIPMILYACERLTRTLRSNIRRVKVLKVASYPGNVLALQVNKPDGFKYQSGQYMFVRCAAVSPFEWHPFSITSAPQDKYLSVHIRAVGDWTRQLKEIFSKECGFSSELDQWVCNTNIGPSFSTGNDHSGNNSYSNLPRIKIDGPYGAPAQDYQKYEVLLLVGLGIGATPFISIVKDILNNLEQLEAEGVLERDLERGSGGDGSHSLSPSRHRRSGGPTFKTRRAYFYWMTREQGSFDWFRGMMNEVAERDNKGVIEMHNHCTSMFEEGDARCALITMLQSLNHAKNGVDVVAGTRVKTHFGRPDWPKVYKRIAVQHPDQRIGVFYCGNPTPVKQLRQLALDFSRKTSTIFDFHKENF